MKIGAQQLVWLGLVLVEVSHPMCYCREGAECCRGRTFVANAFAFYAVLLHVKVEG